MQPTPHHGTSHELAPLERYVGNCVRQLPKLPVALPHQLPRCCASYHASCSVMLREALAVLGALSPRLSQLVAQIWDLTSINMFVLLQLAQSLLDEKDVAHAKWQQLQRFCEETSAQHVQRVAKYESELERARLDASELRAELQKTRQKANRLAVENAQLRKAVNGLMDMNESLHGRVDGSGMPSAVDKLDDASSTSVDANTIGDAEEWGLYGVSYEDLDKLDLVHPIETYAQDFDQLFEGLYNRARDQLALVNEMDRFMNSNVVSLLWRHGPDEDNTRFLQQMMAKRTTGTQTEDDELGILNDDDDDDALVENDDDGEGDGDNNSSDKLSGETGTATVVTKRQLLPPSLRAQLTTRPKIQRVLEKDQLSRVVLLLLLDKMESDGAALRAPQRQPRAPLHRFMKEFFVKRYGLVSLGEHRMMEFVKSLLYYHEKLETEARRLHQLTGSAQAATATEVAAPPPPWAFSLLPPHQELVQLSCDDLRLALFTRLCELAPLQWGDASPAPAGGNLFASAFNALVDFVGDVVELDRSCGSLRDVLERRPAAHWELSLELAALLVGHHFSHCEPTRLQVLQRRLRALMGGANEPLALVAVDALLLFFATQWLELDQQLTAKLHEAFHREVAKLQQHRDAGSSEAAALSPIDAFRRVWHALPGEHLSPLELNDLENAFAMIVEQRQTQQAQQQQRRVSKRQSIVAAGATHGSRPGSAVAVASARVGPRMGLCVGGVSEKEFVFHTQQILRVRRGCRGLRTNGRCVMVATTSGRVTGDHAPQALGPGGRPMDLTLAREPIAYKELKPEF